MASMKSIHLNELDTLNRLEKCGQCHLTHPFQTGENMPTISLNSANNTVYQNVTTAHFGGNFLFHRNSTSDNGSFNYAAEKTGVTNLRFPGGSITEDEYNIKLPNDSSGGKVGLSQFMQYAGENGNSVTIVVPIDKSFYPGISNPSGRGFNEQQLKTFIEACIDYADQNGVTIKAFELGNEYWSETEANRAEIYGQKASIAAKIIDQTIKSEIASPTDHPDIFVQIGSHNNAPENIVAENNAIISGFINNPGSLATIDGLVDHRYATGELEEFKPLIGLTQVASWRNVFKDAGLDSTKISFNWTEWNVKASGNSNGEHSPEDGLRQAGAIISLFNSGVGAANVKSMNIWPHFLPGTETSLSVSDGSTTRLTAAGKAFQLMSESLVGTKSVDISASTNAVDISAFKQDGEKLIVFVTSRSESTQSLDVALGNLTTGYHHVWAKSLNVQTGAVDDYMNPTVMKGYNGSSLQSDSDPNIDLTLKPFEVVRLEFTIGSHGVTMTGDNQDAEQDTLTGSAYADRIYGFAGNDNLSGAQGNDIISGGSGNDTLYGGTGVDTLNGGAGNDVYFVDNASDVVAELANGGIDRILSSISIDLNRTSSPLSNVENVTLQGTTNTIAYGSAVNNTLVGNSGANTLAGRAGNDILTGGLGSDTFLFQKNYDSDTVTDFQDNVDTVRLLGYGITTFAQASGYATQSGADVVFNFGDGDTLTIRNSILSTLADDMIFS